MNVYVDFKSASVVDTQKSRPSVKEKLDVNRIFDDLRSGRGW